MSIDGHLVGTMLDRRYRIDAQIARGGMSTVFRGLDTRLDRPVAIKVMDPKFAADPKFLSRFEFEARAVARLKHVGLVAVYDQGLDGELAFLVMELVEGGTLRELLRERGPMPPHAVRAVAEPVLDALGVAHAAGLVHRDIKPENVLISDTGEVKLADFGLVRAIAASSTTSSSVILGTAAYLSPEQVATGVADARSDVYSMGVLVFEMLTGDTPFTGDTSLSIAYQRLQNDVPSPSDFIEGVPDEFVDLVLDATAREPGHRYDNAAAMAFALRGIARTLQLPEYRVPAPRRSAEHASAGFALPRSVHEPTKHHGDARSAPPQVAPPTPPPAAAPPVRQHAPTTAMVDPLRGATTDHAFHQPHGTTAQPHVHHTKVVTTATQRPLEFRPPESGSAGGVPAPASGSGYRFPEHVDNRRRSRRTMIVWLLIVLFLALAVGFGGWWMGSGKYTAVPTIDGLDRDAATTALSEAGLDPVIRNQHSDTVPPDAIIGTDPAAGSRIARNSTVALVVSAGKPVVPPLSVNGESVEAVQTKVREASLTPIDGGEAFSKTAPIGTVAALDPAPGTVVAVDSRVKIVRSKGAPPVELPDVRGQTADEARQSLESEGILVRDTQTKFDNGTDGGDVIATEPKAGTTVPVGTEVTLIVSDAVKVPSLSGKSVSSARDELTGLGLEIQVRQVAPTDRSVVLTQFPSGGTRVQRGSSVTVVSLP